MTTSAQRVFVARQAIFDRALRVHAYELLYREGLDGAAPPSCGEQASSRVILNSFTEIGLERIAGNRQVFINLTRSFFIDHPPIPFERERVVLEILEDVAVDRAMVEAVSALRRDGYRLALDDYEFGRAAQWEPLLPHVEVVKVEVPGIRWERLEQDLEPLRRHPVRLLAEKVETREQYRRLEELGFELFQGYYFSHPQVVSGRRLSENRQIMLQLLARLNDPAVTVDDLEQLIAHDPGLSFKILRCLNSAAIGLPRTIDSIGQAVVYLGLERLRAWASLAVLSGIEEKPEELFITALVRAHLCARLAGGETAFTAGLLSVLDRLMDLPMARVIGQLPLSTPLQQALLHHHGPVGQALACASAIEEQRWDEIRFPGMTTEELQDAYLTSSELAFQEFAALVG